MRMESKVRPDQPGASASKQCPYDPTFQSCPGPQTQACIDFCGGFVPNGCDCFGCCEVYIDGQPKLIYLGSANCSTDKPENCATCTQQTDCVDPCEECELCLGKTIADLPAKCFGSGTDAGVDAGPPSTCTIPGRESCITNQDCPTGFYCLTGCCRFVDG